VTYNFQTGNNKIKLLSEYESVTQSIKTSMRRVQRCQLKLSELLLHIRKQFYFPVSSFKITGHGNPDNNLESPCINHWQDYSDGDGPTAELLIQGNKDINPHPQRDSN
jgi:hypothetical protein